MRVQNFHFEKVRALIVGDVMLDQYWHGGTSRISPEAPVPVVHVNQVHERPGGAANVALGVAALGAYSQLLGLIGEDKAADTLENLLSKAGIHYQLDRIPNHATITKLRVLSRNQQMVRLDVEQLFSSDLHSEVSLAANYLAALDSIDVVILSDYGKGTLLNAAQLIKLARAKNIPVIVDPKSQDYALYRGASVITPNLKELEAVVGPCATVEIMVEKARLLLSQYQIENLIITRSEHGLTLVSAIGEVVHIPAVAREVHDVTGAGDTVVAVLSVALASGIALVEAARLGNVAAGIVVGKLGAATVSVSELEAALNQVNTLPLGILSEEALLQAVAASKANGERIVFTNGCFDILHSGHVAYLEEAKRLGDRVIVAINDDASVARIKGADRPVNSLEERMAVVAGLRAVDWVVAFKEETPERLIKRIIPHLLVKGGDYQNVEALPGAKFVLSQGGAVRILGLKAGRSTTGIINTIHAREKDVMPT